MIIRNTSSARFPPSFATLLKPISPNHSYAIHGVCAAVNEMYRGRPAMRVKMSWPTLMCHHRFRIDEEVSAFIENAANEECSQHCRNDYSPLSCSQRLEVLATSAGGTLNRFGQVEPSGMSRRRGSSESQFDFRSVSKAARRLGAR